MANRTSSHMTNADVALTVDTDAQIEQTVRNRLDNGNIISITFGPEPFPSARKKPGYYYFLYLNS